MPINNLTYNPLMTLTVKASEGLPANRFIDYSGGVCSANAAALGATEIAWNSSDVASIIVQGIAIIESGEALFAGDDICTGTDGKAVGQSGSNPVVGKAIEDCSSGDYLRVLLVH